MRHRVPWIDISRGIAILFVVYGHVLGSRGIRFLIYSFHIPLFFFISGLVFSKKSNETFVKFVKRNVKHLLIPYIFFAILYWLFWLYQQHLWIFHHESMKQFLSIFYGNANDDLLSFNVVLWFLPALFVTRVIFACLVHYVTDNKHLVFVLCIFSVIGYLFSKLLPDVKLPLGIESAFTVIVFFGAGYLWNRWEHAKTLFIRRAPWIFLGLFLLMIPLAVINHNIYGYQIDIRVNHLNNYFLFYGAAFSGLLSCIACSMWIGENVLLEYIGRHSLSIYILHPLVFHYLTVVFWENLNRFWQQTIKIFLPLMYTIGATAIILCGMKMYEKAKLAYLRFLN